MIRDQRPRWKTARRKDISDDAEHIIILFTITENVSERK